MDEDKSIDWQTVGDCLQALGLDALTPSELDFLKSVLDIDGDGTVTDRDIELAFKLLQR